MNVCAVCAFDGLLEPQTSKGGEPSFEVCPCCGYEPGFDEDEHAYRKDWLKLGAPWFSKSRKPPKGWKPPTA